VKVVTLARDFCHQAALSTGLTPRGAMSHD
jgi:hypothetical protein